MIDLTNLEQVKERREKLAAYLMAESAVRDMGVRPEDAYEEYVRMCRVEAKLNGWDWDREAV